MYITVREASKEFGVKAQAIHNWINTGKIKRYIRVGQAGDSKKSGADGRLTYHNLVWVNDIIPLVKAYVPRTRYDYRSALKG